MVPLPVLPVKAPSPNSRPSLSKPFGCHTSGKSLQSSALSNANAPATPLDSISKYANSFGICTSKHAPKSTAINPFESMLLFPKFFPCHTSAKCAPNSFPCHTSKITIPQALCLPHIRDPRGWMLLWQTSRPLRGSGCRIVASIGSIPPRLSRVSSRSNLPNPPNVSSGQKLATGKNPLCYTGT